MDTSVGLELDPGGLASSLLDLILDVAFGVIILVPFKKSRWLSSSN